MRVNVLSIANWYEVCIGIAAKSIDSPQEGNLPGVWKELSKD